MNFILKWRHPFHQPQHSLVQIKRVYSCENRPKSVDESKALKINVRSIENRTTALPKRILARIIAHITCNQIEVYQSPACNANQTASTRTTTHRRHPNL